ncbi:MAG TPA: helix-turn-helix domain-containing protein [Rectinemataceae bacterium]|nr:helix-turn-helix domain-containing protein [Rectinemataceae bacterium]
MAPIGEVLRSAREQKSLSLDRVADETNIAKRYLAALEAEDFTVFPGDPYVIGFLRNYADYLGLPSDDLVASYKNMKIQEQPVPIEELIPRRGPSPLLVVGGAAGLVGVLVVALLLIVGGHRAHSTVTQAAMEHHQPTQYQMDSSGFDKRMYVGDSLLVNLGGQKYKLGLSRIDDAVTLDTPAGPTRLILGEEGTIDLDRNNQPELKVLVSDLAKMDPSKGAELRFDFVSAEAAAAAAAASPTPATDAGPDNGAASQQAAAAPPPEPAAPAGSKSSVLFEAGRSPYPFVLSVTFRGACLFRYEIDRKDRDERYYHKGETITINANNSVKLWASNGQSAKLTVSASGGKSADLDLGGPGEVSVKRIAWSQADSGNWTLSAYDMD